MLLLAANDHRETIEKDIVQDSIDLVEWELKMRRLHDPIDAENKIALMESKIKRQLEANGMMTERKIVIIFRFFFKSTSRIFLISLSISPIKK